jgi:hypothetical protein
MVRSYAVDGTLDWRAAQHLHCDLVNLLATTVCNRDLAGHL